MQLDNYQKFIHYSRYARWIEQSKRRETWEETVERYIVCLSDRFSVWTDYLQSDCKHAILNLDVMPSMRCLMTAGEALNKHNAAGYNCAYLTISSLKAFDEMLYLLMCGTGVGYSVESKYVNQLPGVPDEFHKSDTVIGVADSKIGWASSFRELLALLFSGKLPSWNLDKLRPRGSRLKTFGGRASGPEPLNDLFKFVVETLQKAKGRKLTPLECHDICCKIASIVVVGGVRRSALISLSDEWDRDIRRAKVGNWQDTHPFRAFANNSAVYESKPSVDTFLREWENLYVGKCGERGIFNRAAAQKKIGENGRRSQDHDFGTNPCCEILLRDREFCNLTEVVLRPDSNLARIREQIQIASFLGTLQSTLTDFKYLSSQWKKNCEDERLLGVSLTGIMDHPGFNSLQHSNSAGILGKLKDEVIKTNERYSKELGINVSAATTCVKPSGTVSQLVNSASGIHPRFSPFYIRRVLLDIKDPLGEFMGSVGFVHRKLENQYIFEFPIKSPTPTLEIDSLDQLKLWSVYNDIWCEHKPSMTCYYDDDNFLKIGGWVYKNFDKISGISFFPKNEHNFGDMAPYQEITEEEYIKLQKAQPVAVCWEEFTEEVDNTTSSQEAACSAGVCEI